MSHVIDHHLLVLPVHDGSGSWPTDVLERLFNPSGPAVPTGDRTTVADYWADATAGDIRVRATVAPAAVIPGNDPDWTVVRDQVEGTRVPALAQVVRKALIASGRAIGGDVDTIVVWGALPSHRDFATRDLVEIIEGVHVTLCHVSVGSSHFTICHEIGHTLGYPHPFGLTSTDPQGRPESEYGSPHCVMGGARRSVNRNIPVWSTAPAPPAVAALWSLGGPRLSAASRFGLILERLARIALFPVQQAMPDGILLAQDGPTGHHTVADPGGPAGVPRAIAFKVEPGWLVVELRRPRSGPDFDWDAGLGITATDVDTHEAAGLVVHHVASVLDIRATDAEIRDGSAWKHHRPIFQGTVPVPLGARRSLDVAAGSARITLTSFDATAGTAGFTIERSAGAPSARLMLTENVVTATHPLVPAGSFEVGGTTETCTISTFQGWWQNESRRVGWQADGTGFKNPEFAWRVAGVQVGDWKGQATPREVGSAHVVEIEVAVPTGPGRADHERQSVRVRATTVWNALSLDFASPRGLTLRPGQGTLRIPVEVFVREPGDLVHRASARGTAETTTRRLVFGADHDEARAACRNAINDMFGRLSEVEPELFTGIRKVSEVVPGPDWGLAEMARLRERFDQIPALNVALERLAAGDVILDGRLTRRRSGPR